MKLFSLLEDEVGPGVVNTIKVVSFVEATIRFLIRQDVKFCHVFNSEECSHCKWEQTTNDSHVQV